jgi:hypothetical protein
MFFSFARLEPYDSRIMLQICNVRDVLVGYHLKSNNNPVLARSASPPSIYLDAVCAIRMTLP